jgi:Family of unknown function (DUF6152)
MRFKLFVAAAGLGLFVIGVASSEVGHHNSAGFDTQNLVNLRGTITSVQWINPHAWIQIAVKAPAGGVEDWMIEVAPPSILVRRGLTKDSLKAQKLSSTHFRQRMLCIGPTAGISHCLLVKRFSSVRVVATARK